MRPLKPVAPARIVRLLLFFAVFCFGCAPQEKPRLYIYCNETFWYVMQAEAILFHKVYGFDITLIPLRSQRTSIVAETTVDVGNSLVPAPWQSMPNDDSINPVSNAELQNNTDIKQQIERIAAERFGDLFLSDSHKQLEELQKLALPIDEVPVCYLTLTMLVPKGNPHQFHSVKEVLESECKLGIVEPSRDGLGESSWQMLGNFGQGSESSLPNNQIRMYERQYDLLEALEQGQIDAALVWNAASLANFLLIKYADSYNKENEDILREAEREKDTDKLRVILQNMYSHLIETKNFAEEIPISGNPGEHRVVAVPLITLGAAFRYGYCERFADFMRSQQGKDIMHRFGFITD